MTSVIHAAPRAQFAPRDDAEADLVLLRHLRDLAVAAGAGEDPKAEVLIDQLRAVAAAARRPDAGGLSESDRRKAIIFSTFADTIEDLAARVSAAVAAAGADDPLSDYAGRIPGTIKGQKTGVDQGHRARVLAGFAPRTAGELDAAGAPKAADQWDLLFTTDVLSEGVNLQQCGRIFNYDLPWNPMRLVQRHGRVDRIGSRHRSVALGCFFPAAHLDQLLHLEETLQRKLAYADAAMGVDGVLPGQRGRVEVGIADTREQIEAILAENPELFVNGGSQAAAQSGEEYRRRLAQALANPVTREAVLALPWSCGSGFTNPSAPRSGYVFCLRMGRGVRREVPAEAAAGAYRAWEAARAHAWAHGMRYTDPNELVPEAPKAFRDAAEVVAAHGGRALDPRAQGELLARLGVAAAARVQRDVRAVLQASGMTDAERVLAVRAVLDEAGIGVPPAPEPLPALDPAEVHLIAWMAVQGRDRVGPPE